MSTHHQVFLFLVGDPGAEVLMEASDFAGPPTQGIPTDVERGDTIEWLPGNLSGIASIGSIIPTEDNLFSNLTIGGPNGCNTGIKSNATQSPPDFSYTVEVSPVGNVARRLTFDPKIRVIH